MDFILGFLTVTAVAILGVISPGPDTAVVMKNSLLKSREDGIWTAMGIALGNVVYVSLALLGLGVILTSSVALFTVVKLCGALYLLLLGINLLISKKKDATAMPDGSRSPGVSIASFREGLLTNFSNPKFMVFLLALFTQVIDPATPLMVQALYAYQIPVLAFLWFATLSVILTTPAVKSRVAGFMHIVERVTGVVLIALSLKVALSDSN